MALLISSCVLEDDVTVLESGLDEDAEDVVEIVGVAGDERLVERFSPRDVGDAVDDAGRARESRASSSTTGDAVPRYRK